MQKGHYNGKKQRGNHTTVTPATSKIVNAADKMAIVTGISVGFIDSKARSKKPRVKFFQTSSGLRVEILGSTSKQTIVLFTSPA